MTAVAAQAMRRSGRPSAVVTALAALGAGYCLSYLFRNVNGVVGADIMRDLGIGAGALGWLTAAYLLAFSAAQLPVGMLLDRYGPRRVQALLLLCAAAGAALCGLDGGPAAVLFGRAMIGLGTAGCLMAGLKASAAWVAPGQVALANGVFVMCGGLGALMATWPVELGLRLVDWRGLHSGLAVLACATALLIWYSVPELEPAGSTRTGGTRTGGTRIGSARADAPRLRDIARDPMFRRFAPLSSSCFGTVLGVQGLWTGPWLADVDALTRPEVADGLAYMAMALVIAAPCWGVLTRWLRNSGRLMAGAGAAALVLMGTEALITAHLGVSPVLPWSVFALFGGMSVFSYSVLASHFPQASIGRANGALNVLHIGVSFAVQLAIGQVVSLWPEQGGHYPAHAYQCAMLLPLALQATALVWFAWPRRALGTAPAPVPL